MTVQPLEQFEGKYRILAKIGEGGMGTVYKVRHLLLDEVRVIKVMRQQDDDQEGVQERFTREARIAVKVRHPNIAQMYDFAIDETGTAFIVMEYVNGITLQRMLKRAGPPQLGLTLEIARQSLKALSHLHKAGIVHRDISPDNLMLTRNQLDEPRIKLIDLGIAKTVAGKRNLTATGVFLGKIRYASPEQFKTQGEAPVDYRSDLYSFAVVLYELLTGVHPIKGDSFSRLIAGHLFDPPIDFGASDPDSKIPDRLREVVLKALEKPVGDRFQDAASFRNHITDLQPDHPWSNESLIDALAPAEVDRFERSPQPGSTQERINRQFVEGAATPPPLEGIAADAGKPDPTMVRPVPQGEKRADALVVAAEHLADLELWQEAKIQLGSALKLQPNHSGALAFMSRIEAAESRAKEVSEAVSVVEGMIEDGNLEMAAQNVGSALERLSGATELEGIQEWIHQLQQERLETDVAELVRRGEDLLGEQKPIEAMKAFEEGLRLKPDDPAALAGLERARKMVNDRRAGEARTNAIAEVVAVVEGLIEEGDLNKAEVHVHTALGPLAGAPEIEALQERIHTLRRETTFLSLLEEAAAATKRGRHRSAVEMLELATELNSEHPNVRQLLNTAREELAHQQEEEQREAVVSSTLSRVEDLLRDDRIDEAAAALKITIAVVGDVEELRDAREKVEIARQTRLEHKAESLIKRGKEFLEEWRIDDAVAAFEGGLRLHPSNEAARSILARARTLQKEREAQKAEEEAISEAVDDIDRVLALGRLDDAAKRLSEARDRFRDDRPFSGVADNLHRAEAARSLAQQVAAQIRQAQESISKGDDLAAFAALERAAELDPGHGTVQALLKKTRERMRGAQGQGESGDDVKRTEDTESDDDPHEDPGRSE